MRLAITTDWLVTEGGAERVIAEMLKLWGDAEVFTTVYREGCLEQYHPKVRVSRLQKWFKLTGNHRVLLPWMPRAVESWDLRGNDVIVSSSHAVAKGCIPPSSARHICYCHTPMRYAWEMEEKYLDDFHLKGPLKSLARWQLKKIRRWDKTTAKRVDTFIANSHETAERIKRVYDRDSIVLHPPVNDRFFDAPLAESKEDYFLSVGRMVPYKRVDLTIQATNELQVPLKVVGEGPEMHKLKKLAGPTVEFLGRVSEEELHEIYAKAKATIFPVHEDAGIVPLESQACGTPVIAYGKGGVRDTVEEGKTGVFFPEQTVESLKEAMQRIEGIQTDPRQIREHAKQFSATNFRSKLSQIVS